MKVKTKDSSYNDKFVSLEEFFTTYTGGYDSGGVVEQARELAEKNSRLLGFIVAQMVRKDPALFDQAKQAADVGYPYYDAELHMGDEE